ncbi:MAG: SdpI family protein [Eubacteriales bacterium]|nr:SdpI family protein [Eubacteriales bacterium]
MRKIKWKYINWMLLFLCIASFTAHLILYPKFPDQVPVHWGIDGEVDRYSSKTSVLFLAALPLFICILFYLIPMIDPRRKNYRYHTKAYHVCLSLTVLLLIVFNWVSSLIALGYQFDISQIIIFGIGILFIGLGNYMPQIRPNYYFGVRTPWAIENPWVWKKTQRMGGILFLIMGVVLLPFSFLPDSVLFPVLMGMLFGSMALVYLYSYLMFLKAQKMGYFGQNDIESKELKESEESKCHQDKEE